MLIAVEYQGDMLMWHAKKCRDGDRISYLEHHLPKSCEIRHNELLKARHTIGWCSNIKHHAGHPDGPHTVESPELQECSPLGALRGFLLSPGQPILGVTSVRFSDNHRPVSLTQRTYLDRFRYLERRQVLLWDVQTSRWWLLNGLRAALHLLRQSLQVDADEDLGHLFVLRPEYSTESLDSWGPQSARQFLSDIRNLSARVTVSNIGPTGREYETLRERLDRLYGILEQAFDHQPKGRDWCQIPRSQLEGWDFLSLARKDEIIEPRMASLHAMGHSWVDFTRAIGAVTLFGNNYSDLLQTRMAICDPVPPDRYCLTVAVSDLCRIPSFQANASGLQPLMCRNPNLVWYSPAGSTKPCRCEGDKTRAGAQPMQVIWPADYVCNLPAGDFHFTLKRRANGVVIFGHDDGLTYYIPSLGAAPIQGQSPDTNTTLERYDSGLGSSIGSTTSPGRSRAMSPVDDDCLTTVSSPVRGHSYESSSMSGGYGIFSNFTGKLSVYQFYMSAPNNLSSSDVPSQSPRESRTITRESDVVGANPPLMEQHVPFFRSEEL